MDMDHTKGLLMAALDRASKVMQGWYDQDPRSPADDYEQLCVDYVRLLDFCFDEVNSTIPIPDPATFTLGLLAGTMLQYEHARLGRKFRKPGPGRKRTPANDVIDQARDVAELVERMQSFLGPGRKVEAVDQVAHDEGLSRSAIYDILKRYKEAISS